MKAIKNARVVIGYGAGVDSTMLRQTVLGVGFECVPEDCVCLKELGTRLAHATADLVVVAMGEEHTNAVEKVREAVQLSSAPVWVVGPTDDSQLVIQTVRAGAQEYLNVAEFHAELDAALEKFATKGKDPRRRGVVISIFAPTAGSGGTTVAANVAAALAEIYPQEAALIELKPDDGDLSVLLDLTPQYTLSDVCQRWERMDTLSLSHSFVDHQSGLKVLPQAVGHGRHSSLRPEALRRLIVLARNMFRFTVLDLDSGLDEARVEAMKLSDFVGVVVRLDVPAVRRAQRAIQEACDRGVSPQAFRLIASRYGQAGLLPLKRVEEALGIGIAGEIPDDPAKVNKATNRGRLLHEFARRAKITRCFTSLAMNFNGKS